MRYYRQVVGALSTDTPVSTWSQWVWPLRRVNGNWPTRSDGFGVNKRGGKGHFGCDIMHRKRSGDPSTPGSTHYTIFPGEVAILSGPGKVWESSKTSTGWTVKVSHRVDGRPIMSVYRHLKNSNVEKGQLLPAGWVLGEVGDNPAHAGDPAHLHFELWDTSLNNTALVSRFSGSTKGGEYLKWVFNPAKVMNAWKVIVAEDGSIVPHGGDAGDQGEKPGGGGGGGLVAGLLLLGGWLTFRKSQRRYA